MADKRDKLADAIANARGGSGSKSIVAVAEHANSDSAHQLAVQDEEQARFYLRSGNEKALRLHIDPIEIMKKNPIYKERFERGYYDPVLLRAELAVLEAQEGENQWLKGERFSIIRDSKMYKSAYGYDSFEEFIRNDTPYARSTVYNWIKVYEKYSYVQSIKLGSKLTLLTQTMELTKEQDQQTVMKNIENLSFRDAKAFLTETQDKKPTMKPEDLREDTFGAYTPPGPEPEKTISTARTAAAHETYEPIEVKLVPAYLRARASRSGEVRVDKTGSEALARHHFPVLVGLDNEILQKYYFKAVQDMEKSIRSRIEAELAKPENKADLRELKKLQKK